MTELVAKPCAACGASNGVTDWAGENWDCNVRQLFYLRGTGACRPPDWDAIAIADPCAQDRDGFRNRNNVVHKTLTDGNVVESVCRAKRCNLAIDDWRLVTCAGCLQRRHLSGGLIRRDAKP